MTISTEQRLLASIPTQLLVNGVWQDSATGLKFAVDDPATGAELTTVADASAVDARAAMDAAASTQASWAATAPRDRADILRRAFELVHASAEDFALLITLEMGKTLAEARAEVNYGAEFLRWFSEEAVRTEGRYTPAPDGNARLLVTKKPVGPSLLITPWNFPLAMATRKLAPAIAAGCTSIIKPAPLTPLTTLLLAKIMIEAGVPAGVVNVIPTSTAASTVAPLIADPRLRKLSFTGSTEVGRKLLAQAAPTVLRTSMELGGNAPFLVFEDADLDAAIEGALAAKLRNIGQACTAANRFYVHEDVADAFATKLADRFAAKHIGRGTEDGVEIGPLIDEPSRSKVHGLVEEALGSGATAIAGGVPLPGPGWFYPPTVLTNVPAGARILSEEIFGPVAPIATFRTEKQAIALANATPYGLAAYAYTKDLSRVLRLTEQLETGMLGINAGVISNPAAPFGGVKQSGLGREGGREGIEEYLETMYVGISNPR
ncbi:NAD-dependent succinate-semialdehyde dehydrogenase [Nocardia sp. NPDC049737]|uniref:NAD-dependent succinate-semialdehyde dehydrogenase n=1 Tax=Nocardia sp. NPDC049737 TaxID=3154358 RepID=UPI0034442978